MIIISAIVAMGNNNEIGKDNNLLWHLPADMKFFKEKTTNRCIITGRKNYESIPEKFRPLPNRTNIVITNQKDYSAPGAIVVNSLETAIAEAMKKGDTIPLHYPRPEIFIIGGGQIYKEALEKNLIDRLYITEVDGNFDADVFFPVIDKSLWKETSRTKHLKDEKNLFDYSFVVLDRIY